MNNLLRWLVVGLMLFVALAACSLAPDLSYDSQPGTVILYADVQARGIPRYGETCKYKSVPSLRIWGDGLVFLDVSMYGQTESPLWNGKLSAEQIKAILQALQYQGFFNKTWGLDGPNPAGTWFYMGGKLKKLTVDYESGDLQPKLYQDLITTLKPNLTPFTLDKKPDTRFDQLNIGTLDCTQTKQP